MGECKKEFPVAVYGAGAVANSLLKRLQAEYNVVCFCETAKEKCGGTLAGLPILQAVDAQKQFEDLHFYVAARTNHKYNIMDFLINNGVEKERILNYAPYKKYCSCVDIESRMGISGDFMLFCCGSLARHRSPLIRYTGDPIQDMNLFTQKRDEILHAFEHDLELPEYAEGCKNCPNRQVNFWPIEKVIDDVCFSIKHKCNFRCSYCIENDVDKSELTGNEHLDEALAVLDEMSKQGILSDKAIVAVSSTEISVHPYKEKILDVLNKHICQFTTNAAVYVDQISEGLRNGGKVYCSLDAGTPETFRKVKGVNEQLYWRVIDNLIQYGTHGVVEAKYIFLTDVNDNKEDVEGFIAACEKIKPVAIHIARDSNTYDVEKCLSTQTLDMMVYMIRLAKEKGFHVNCSPLVFNTREYDYLKSNVKF